jgi:ATP-dependent Clp protease protease subunit
MINGQNNFDWYGDFKSYAMSTMGITGMQFHYWEKLQETLYNNVNVMGSIAPITPQDSLTPYILEEREMRVTQMDIFSRMMRDRILWLAGPVNDQMSTVSQAQLMFLDNLEEKDITVYVDSPGGSVKSGLSIVDVMNYVGSDIVTVNTGMAASMGSILLGSGTKGKRYSLKHSKVMLHQVSHGTQGNVQDTRIGQAEAEKYNDELFRMLGEYTDKDPKQVMEDASRDLWLDSETAKAYGIVDDIILKKNQFK